MKKISILLLLLMSQQAPHISGKTASGDIKVLMLIIASDELPIYQEEQKIWRSYMHLDSAHCEVYFIKGDPHLAHKCEAKGDILWSKTSETYRPGILNKTIMSLEYMLPRLYKEFDYVIRTNLSSFYSISRLLTALEKLPKAQYYGGSLGIYGGYPFVGGAGIIISSDLAIMLVEHRNELINSPEIDDIAIAKFFRNHNVLPVGAPRTDFLTIETWSSHKNTIDKEAFHFRTKNSNGFRMSHELLIQRELLKMFYGLECK